MFPPVTSLFTPNESCYLKKNVYLTQDVSLSVKYIVLSPLTQQRNGSGFLGSIIWNSIFLYSSSFSFSSSGGHSWDGLGNPYTLSGPLEFRIVFHVEETVSFHTLTNPFFSTFTSFSHPLSFIFGNKNFTVVGHLRSFCFLCSGDLYSRPFLKQSGVVCQPKDEPSLRSGHMILDGRIFE